MESLVQTNQQPAVNAAVRRRDSLLGTYPLASNATGSQNSEQTGEAASTSTPTTGELPVAEHTVSADSTVASHTDSKPPLSPSQEVAQSVLADQSMANVPLNAVNPSPLARLKTAASAPEGSTDSPIQVSIVERSLLVSCLK